ncbi:TRAP transporter small permease [Desulfopila aestuarii]|uniref:TRAP-type C4-dicarboxylate transport system, small permease component n=1 Tax=Desulfopila aestuarii DSM 18488 TaxID=1121416 RepID=A0A1M7XY03_9BACT|nr:TRAP transporter small permease [Desulfopila aestuarii]SHO43881.1 TRAP-type C4-dicarboxylate transport system, small permease component [Desulfopila aestuarii DSM 18488]
MKHTHLINTAISIVRGLTIALSVVASLLLCAMVVVIVFNVGSRFLFKMPLYGTIELVELMMIIISFIAIAYTSMQRGHVRITILTDKLPQIIQDFLGRFVSLLNVTIFSLILYQAAINAVYSASNLHHRTDTLDIPIAPFKILMVLGVAVLLCIEITHVFRPLSPELDSGE